MTKVGIVIKGKFYEFQSKEFDDIMLSACIDKSKEGTLLGMWSKLEVDRIVSKLFNDLTK